MSRCGRVAELAYAQDLGSCLERGGGSTPLSPILLRPNVFTLGFAGIALSKNDVCCLHFAESKDPTKYYIGFTENLNRRLIEHNTAESGYSKRYAPWEVESFVTFRNREKAMAFEKYLKMGSGHSFLKRRLI